MSHWSVDRRALITSGGAAALLWSTQAQAQPGQARYGVVEIGASGVKVTAFTFARGSAREPRGARDRATQSPFDRYESSVLGSFNENPVARERDQIGPTVQSVLTAITRLQREHNVPRNNIVTVGSSSVAAVSHSEQLASALRARGVDLEYISAAQEAELVARWIVPPPRYGEAMVVDIGSGNTKGGFIVGTPPNSAFEAFEVRYGSRSLAARVDGLNGNNPSRWNATLVSAARTEIGREAQGAVSRNPGFGTRPRAYLVGGAVWALAAVMHPGPSVDPTTHWVPLTTRDIAAFREAAFAGRAFNIETNAGLAARLSRLRQENPALETEARALVQRVSEVIAPDQARAGAEILSVLAREFRFSQKQAIFFSKEGLYAWPSMYLLRRLNIATSR